MYKNRIPLLFIATLLIASVVPQDIQAVENEEYIANSSPNYFQFNSEITRRFIVFPDTKEDYEYLLETSDVIKAFPNLRAALIETTIGAIEKIRTEVGPAYDTSVHKLDLEVPPVVEARMTLDSLEDAPFMGVDKLWDLGYSGQNVTVGVVDNGVEVDHPGLKGRIIEQTWFETSGLGTRDPFHGTPVSGTIVGTGDDDPLAKGNAFNATVISAAWRMQDNGRSFETGADNIHYFEAFDYMISKNQTMKIINYSGGGGYYAPFANIFQRIEEAGMLLITSAGNGGSGRETVGCPACYIETLAVGATNRDQRSSLTSFSSRGPGAIFGMKPDVAAPGADVYSTELGGGYGRVSGTSFSSPLTAGAVATLISALNAENYTWNVGTLKAAVLQGAFMDYGKMDYLKGAGDVNIYNSYTSIKSENPNGGFAEALAVTPNTGGLFDMSYFPDITSNIDGFTVVTSNASKLNIRMTGDLSQVLSLDMSRWDNNSFSQYLPLDIDTTGVAQGVYSGSIVASLGGIERTVSLSITVLDNPVGKILFDERHTQGDLFGLTDLVAYQTRLMSRNFKNLGYQVVRENQEITSSLLANYNLVWMPEVLGPFDYTGQPLLNSEITAIGNFVDSGGSVLVSYQGLLDDGHGGVFGPDPVAINELTSQWGISPYTMINESDTSGSGIPLNNVSSIVGSATQAGIAGNFLSLDVSKAATNNAVLSPLVGDSSRTFLASYDQIDGGRVVVTSSADVLSNKAIMGDTATSKVLAQNIAKWLTSENRMYLIAEEETTTELTVTVRSRTQPTARRIGNEFMETESKEVKKLMNGDYQIVEEYDVDGPHTLEVSNGDEYLRWDRIVDNYGPDITPDIENNTYFTYDELYGFVKYTIVDASEEIKFDQIEVLFDGASVDPVLFKQFYTNNLLKVRIPLSEISTGEHTLTVRATDSKDHVSVNNLVIYRLAEGEEIPTTTSTNTTTSETTLPDTTTEDTSFYPIFVFVSAALITIPVVRRKISRRQP